jgi:hypothetical protein
VRTLGLLLEESPILEVSLEHRVALDRARCAQQPTLTLTEQLRTSGSDCQSSLPELAARPERQLSAHAWPFTEGHYTHRSTCSSLSIKLRIPHFFTGCVECANVNVCKMLSASSDYANTPGAQYALWGTDPKLVTWSGRSGPFRVGTLRTVVLKQQNVPACAFLPQGNGTSRLEPFCWSKLAAIALWST